MKYSGYPYYFMNKQQLNKIKTNNWTSCRAPNLNPKCLKLKNYPAVTWFGEIPVTIVNMERTKSDSNWSGAWIHIIITLKALKQSKNLESTPVAELNHLCKNWSMPIEACCQKNPNPNPIQISDHNGEEDDTWKYENKNHLNFHGRPLL